MSADNPWKYSAYFKLYGKDGLQVSFSVNGEDADVHIAQVGDYLTQLIESEGFSITPEGVKPGEKLQEVDGWVLGETSEGQPCIHLYKSPLQWKVATVYEERMKDIPVKPDRKTFQWPGAAPEREAAERRGAINPCNFTIVLVPSGKTSEKGNPIFKFDRALGMPSSSSTSAASSSPKQGKKGAESVQSYADLYGMLKDENKKLADWCRKAHGDPKNKGVAGGNKIAILCEEIDNVTGTEASAEAVLEVLTGIPTFDLRDQMKSYVANGLIKWISPYVQQNGEAVENPDRRPAIVESIKYIWGMANGYNEVNQRAAEGSSKSGPKDMDYRDSDIPF